MSAYAVETAHQAITTATRSSDIGRIVTVHSRLLAAHVDEPGGLRREVLGFHQPGLRAERNTGRRDDLADTAPVGAEADVEQVEFRHGLVGVERRLAEAEVLAGDGDDLASRRRDD